MSPPTAIGLGEPTYRFWLPGHPPGANQLTRMNRWDTGRARSEWKDTTILAIRSTYRTSERRPIPRAVLHFECTYRADRRRDFDNLVASFKPIIDGIVAGGLLIDDSLDHVAGIFIDVRIDRRVQGITVEVIPQGIAR